MKKKLITGLLALTMCVSVGGALVGCAGNDGANGKSAYEIAVENGFKGTEAEWLESLKGDQGIPGTAVNGKSAYELAVEKGYTGTEEQWLASLVGATGTGKSAYDLAVENGYTGTVTEWIASLAGENGKSAYELAVKNGFEGTEAEWLASLKGEDAYVCEEHDMGKVKVIAKEGVCTSIQICNDCGFAEIVENDHKMKAGQTVEATCKEYAYTASICEDCGYEADKVEDTAAGYAEHTWVVSATSNVAWNDEEEEYEATDCTEDGTVTYYCSYCSVFDDPATEADEKNLTETTVTYEALGHTDTYAVKTPVVNVGETMCVNGGMWTYYCERCKEVVTELQDPIGHAVDTWTITKATALTATVTATGTCSAEDGHCGDPVTITLPELKKENYDYVQCNCKSADTFDRYYIYIEDVVKVDDEGKIVSGVSATASETATKYLVAEINVGATYHVLNGDHAIPENGVIKVLNTTTGVKEFAGQKAESCLPEGYGAGYFVCSVCGLDVEVVTMKAHDYTGAELTTAPAGQEAPKGATCTEAGWKYVSCKVDGCDGWTKVDLEALDHDYKYTVVDNGDGTQDVEVSCGRCDYNDDLEGVYVAEGDKQEPTCEENGWVIYSADLEDGTTVKTDKFTLLATGHYVVIEGEKVYMDKVAVDYQGVKAFDITKWTGIIRELTGNGTVKADCATGSIGSGFYECGCADCDPVEVAIFRSHVWDEDSYDHKDATCTEPGMVKGVCTVCEYESDWAPVETEPALGHTAEIVTARFDPNMMNWAEIRIVCSVCETYIDGQYYNPNYYGTWSVNEDCIKVWTYEWKVETAIYTGVLSVSIEGDPAHVIIVDGEEEVITNKAYDVVEYAAYIKEFAGQKATCKVDANGDYIGYGAGYMVCAKCGDSVEVVTSNKNGHVYNENSFTTYPATCTTNAYKKGECTVCEQIAIQEIPNTKLGHDFYAENSIVIAEKLTAANLKKALLAIIESPLYKAEFENEVEYEKFKTQFMAEIDDIVADWLADIMASEEYEAIDDAEGTPAFIAMVCGRECKVEVEGETELQPEICWFNYFTLVDLADEENMTKDVEATCSLIGEREWKFVLDAEEVGTLLDVEVIYKETDDKVPHAAEGEDDYYVWDAEYTDGITYKFQGYICKYCGQMIIEEMDPYFTLTVVGYNPAASMWDMDRVWTYTFVEEYVIADEYELLPRAGYTFLGYIAYDEDGNEVEVTLPTVLTSDLTVFATWEQEVYTITFVDEEGEEVDTMDFVFGNDLYVDEDTQYMGTNSYFFEMELTNVYGVDAEDLPETWEAKNYTFTVATVAEETPAN